MASALVLAVLLGGCSTPAYYLQAVNGQLAVWADTRPIDEVLADPATPAPVAALLGEVPAMLRFAERELGLPATGSFEAFADVGREAMVWSVVATPVDGLQPLTWCYPVIGCASYRGYFRRSDADAFAAQLAAQGWDVAVDPAPAYSTLGWFDDPLPSTVVGWPAGRVAGLVFHELAHERLYLAGDSAFNEGYATVVETEGVDRWLQAHGSAGERRLQPQRRQRKREFLQLLRGARDQLAAIYADPALSAERRLADKAAVFAGLRRDYASLRAGWGGYRGYDHWFERPLNNARLASIGTYHDLVPAFRQLLREHGGDMVRYHAAADALAARTAAERSVLMAALASGGSAAAEAAQSVQPALGVATLEETPGDVFDRAR